MVTIVDSYGRPRPEDVTLLENRVSSELPSDYKAWLLLSNGGRLLPEVNLRHSPALRSIDQTVYWLYGIAPGLDEDLIKMNELLDCRIPRQFLAIASTTSNDTIVVGLEGSRRGRVYVSPFNYDGDRTKASELRVIADSFESFLSVLHDAQIPSRADGMEEATAEDELIYFVLNNDQDAVLKAVKSYLPDRPSVNGLSPLMLAARYDNPLLVERLLQLHSSVEARDSNGRTAFFHASSRFSVDSLRLLVNAGSDIHTTDLAGQTALQAQVLRGSARSDAFCYLLLVGLDPRKPNKDGKSIIDFCMEPGSHGKNRIVESWQDGSALWANIMYYLR